MYGLIHYLSGADIYWVIQYLSGAYIYWVIHYLSGTDIHWVIHENPGDCLLATRTCQRPFISYVVVSVWEKAMRREAGNGRVFAWGNKQKGKFTSIVILRIRRDHD